MFLRKSLLENHTSDQVSIAIAHELSHVVLESIKHPLRKCEKAVDLTAMLLGFSRLYESASHTKECVGNCIRSFDLGYLSEHELKVANELLTPAHLRQKIKALGNCHRPLLHQMGASRGRGELQANIMAACRRWAALLGVQQPKLIASSAFSEPELIQPLF